MWIIGSAACAGERRPAPASATRPPATAAPPERKYLLERVDDAAVVQVYADGFKELPLKDKTLVWHLYQAALAGRDIFYDQRYAHSLEMRDVLEAIIHAPPAGIDPATRAEILTYTKLFWINSGPFNNLTARKFVLTMHPRGLRRRGARGRKRRRDVSDEKRGNTRPAAGAPATDVLRSERRCDGDEQDAAAWPGHPGRRARTTCTSASR